MVRGGSNSFDQLGPERNHCTRVSRSVWAKTLHQTTSVETVGGNENSFWLNFTSLVLANASVFDSENWCHIVVRASLIGNFSE